MTVTISGTNGIDKVAAGSVESGDIAANAVSQTNLASGVVGNGPAFSAYQSSAQTLSTSTWTKIQLQTEEWDTASCFDNATNYRFTPNVAGYYLFSGAVQVNVSNTSINIAIFKNGAAFKYVQYLNGTSIGGTSGSAVVYCNGTTDYVELYGWLGSGQQLNPAGFVWFQGSMIRSA